MCGGYSRVSMRTFMRRPGMAPRRKRPLWRGGRIVPRRLLEALELARDGAGVDTEEPGRQRLVAAGDAQGLVEQPLLDLGQRRADTHGQDTLGNGRGPRDLFGKIGDV